MFVVPFYFNFENQQEPPESTKLIKTLVANSNIRLQYWVIFIGIALLIIKFIAWWITQSNTIFSDAIESLVNIAMAFLGLVSLYYAARPKDINHPYGHGKVEFLYATVEGMLICFAGFIIIGKAIYNFYHPTTLSQLDLGLGLIAFTGIVNYLLGRKLKQQGKATQSATLISSAEHLISDAVTTVGILLGLLLVWVLKIPWLDNVLAIVFAGWILFVGFRLIRNSLRGIMDEMDEEILEEVVEIINENRHSNWIDVHNLRIIRYGSDLHLDLHLTVPWYFNVEEAHNEVDRFEETMQEKIPQNTEFFIHTDPCIESSCPLCTKKDCSYRKSKQEKTVYWSKDLIRKNQKHGKGE